MKKLIILFLFPVTMLFLSPSQVIADTLSIGAEVPVFYTFRSADDGSSLDADGFPIGIILTSRLPFFNLGVGLEYYETKIDAGGDSSILTIMADAFYVLPLPVVNLAIGGGYGIAQVKGDYADLYESSNASQLYLDLGIPLGETFEINAGIHYIISQIEIKNSDSRLEAGGIMGTVGLSIGL